MLFLLIIFFGLCSSQKNKDLVVEVSLHSGCSFEFNDRTCHFIKGKDNINYCNTPELCYYYSWHMINANGNNAEYWIKWNFILSENFTIDNNRINSPTKSTILDNVNEIIIFSGCNDTRTKCDPVIGHHDRLEYCSNATDCYYVAKTIWERYHMNPDYWIMMVF
jgi:hypothetical protein